MEKEDGCNERERENQDDEGISGEMVQGSNAVAMRWAHSREVNK